MKPEVIEAGLNIKIKRLHAGLKQYELAAKLGIAPTQLCEIETGRKKPSKELLQKLQTILGRTTNEQN